MFVISCSVNFSAQDGAPCIDNDICQLCSMPAKLNEVQRANRESQLARQNQQLPFNPWKLGKENFACESMSRILREIVSLWQRKHLASIRWVYLTEPAQSSLCHVSKCLEATHFHLRAMRNLGKF